MDAIVTASLEDTSVGVTTMPHTTFAILFVWSVCPHRVTSYMRDVLLLKQGGFPKMFPSPPLLLYLSWDSLALHIYHIPAQLHILQLWTLWSLSVPRWSSVKQLKLYKRCGLGRTWVKYCVLASQGNSDLIFGKASCTSVIPRMWTAVMNQWTVPLEWNTETD